MSQTRRARILARITHEFPDLAAALHEILTEPASAVRSPTRPPRAGRAGRPMGALD